MSIAGFHLGDRYQRLGSDQELEMVDCDFHGSSIEASENLFDFDHQLAAVIERSVGNDPQAADTMDRMLHGASLNCGNRTLPQ